MSLPPSYTKLTRLERAYVDGRLSGLSKVAAATAAGSATPKVDCTRIEKREHVQRALVDRMQQTADEVDFGRREAHDMYMDAYQNAETAMEQIAAVNALVKLHGLEKPKEIQVNHTHTGTVELEHMPTDELMKLAGMDKALTLEGEFEEVGEKPILEAPEVTEDNLEKREDVSRLPSDY